MSGAIDLDVVVPHLSMKFGPIEIDPVAQLLGHPIDFFLDSLLRRGSERGHVGGVELVRYPLRVPAGEGVSIPLGNFGEFGFRNDRGQLVLIMPPQSEAGLRRQLGDAFASSEATRGTDGQVVVEMRVNLRKGARFVWALPMGMGELAVEVP